MSRLFVETAVLVALAFGEADHARTAGWLESAEGTPQARPGRSSDDGADNTAAKPF